MTNEEKKKKLYEYKNVCKRLSLVEEQIAELRSVMESAKSQQISDMPKALGKQQDLSDVIIKIENLERKMDKEMVESLRVKTAIEESIFGVIDADENKLLRLRYLQFRKWEDICYEMHYSWRQVHYIHGRALKNINIA